MMFLKNKKNHPPSGVIKRGWKIPANLRRGFSQRTVNLHDEFLGDRWSLPLCARTLCPSSRGDLPVTKELAVEDVGGEVGTGEVFSEWLEKSQEISMI